jgi:chromosome segregation protein
LISRLNKESIDKFTTTFEQVRINFQEVFRKLFGGGRADIILEQPEDVLESGIEIVARPPGKETRSISLLSGGEKTMTAIALLFAIFKTKPSPFCFLDEVDAALDEANNERFNLIVQEFKKNSQFIIITHAKRTMSIADVLVGITMQQKGVSKKISVKFDSYEPQQEEEAAAVA